MEILNLCRAEWMKMRHHKLNLIMLVVSITLEIVIMIGIVKAIAPKGSPEWIAKNFSFPGSLYWPAMVVSPMAWFVLPVLIANTIGLDYTLDTWKTIIPRSKCRWHVLTSKLMIATLMLICWIAIMIFTAALFGAAYSLITGTPVLAAQDHKFYDSLCRVWLAIIATTVCYGAITSAATILLRSVASGALVTFLALLVFMVLAKFCSESVAILTPIPHFGNLLFAPPNDGYTIDLTRISYPVWVSWLVISGYVLASIGAAFCAFDRQDLATE